MAEKKKEGLVRPTTTDRQVANHSLPAFGGLLKPSVDSLLARRISFRPPPMTMSRGDDSHIGNGFSKTGLGLCESAARSSDKAHPCKRRRGS
jgi:hypothetical protein